MFNATVAAKFLTHAKIKYTDSSLLFLGLMFVKKYQFLSSIKRDAHKRRSVPFFASLCRLPVPDSRD